MKKLLLFVNSLSAGGAERVVSNLSLNLSASIEKKIIIFQRKVEYPYRGNLIVLKSLTNNIFFTRLVEFIYRYYQIKNIKKNNYGIPTISFLEQPNLLNLLTKRYGKSIISVRNYMSIKHQKGLRAFLWNLSIKYGYKKADKIVAVSEEIKNDLIINYKIPENKIEVIYNFYSIDKITKLSQEKLEEKYKTIFNKPVIMTIGRLNKQKGQKHLIRAFKIVKEYIKDVQLVILGDGELHDELVELTYNFGLAQDIHFLGFKNNPFKYVAKSTVFALTSYHEGFPNVLAESMACGVPVISSDCLSGPREILAPEEINKSIIDYSYDLKRYGILTPVCNSELNSFDDPISKEEQILVNSLLALLNDQELQIHFSNRSLNRVKDFDITKIIRKWEKYCE